MDIKHLVVPRTAHYVQLGEPGPHIRQFWIVCHGYAQLADEFMENFHELDNRERLLVAPEGMHYFYRKGFDGPVGATWMTRRFREAAIADNAHYLQALYERYVPFLSPDVRIVFLGFSQGTATLCRWLMRNKPHFHDLILWAGLPPEDLDYAAEKDYLHTKNLYLLYGSSDPFITEARLQEVQDIEQKNGIDFQENTFDGGHEIPIGKLKELLEKMN